MLPEWANEIGPGKYEIFCDNLYPKLLNELEDVANKLLPPPSDGTPEDAWKTELRGFNRSNLTQYWLEVIYQMAKWELRRTLILDGLNPWPEEIHIRATKSKWAQRLYPLGRGPNPATKGLEAKHIYKYLRGFVPS